MKVLVCDDDEGIADVIRIVLENNNYQVETTLSAKQILEKVKKFSPDLVMLDLTMPKLDVRKTIKLIKKELKFSPIILVSAMRSLDKKARSLQVSDFLEKPFEMTDLLKKVKQHIK